MDTKFFDLADKVRSISFLNKKELEKIEMEIMLINENDTISGRIKEFASSLCDIIKTVKSGLGNPDINRKKMSLLMEEIGFSSGFFSLYRSDYDMKKPAGGDVYDICSCSCISGREYHDEISGYVKELHECLGKLKVRGHCRDTLFQIRRAVHAFEGLSRYLDLHHLQKLIICFKSELKVSVQTEGDVGGNDIETEKVEKMLRTLLCIEEYMDIWKSQNGSIIPVSTGVISYLEKYEKRGDDR